MQKQNHETPTLTFGEIKELISFAKEKDVIELKVGDIYFRLGNLGGQQITEQPVTQKTAAQIIEEHDKLLFMSSN
jgi:hypothetical protein